jgi:hypothetical protein
MTLKGDEMKKLVFCACVALSTSAMAEKWDAINNPNNFSRIAGSSMFTNFNLLPLKARLKDTRLVWSDSYWPSYRGSIAYRWNHPDPQPHRYRFHTSSELSHMSFKEISQLSPAELYDISQGDYNYSLTRKILSMHGPRRAWWEGLCHGWAQAAANYPEPGKIIVVNPDGIRVPFGSSDVKALLTAHDSYNSLGAYSRVADRCRLPGKVPGEDSERDPIRTMPSAEVANSPECRGINAGSFHIVLTNLIGLHGKSFVADIDRFGDVWNQPIVSFESKVLGDEPIGPEHSLQGIQRRVRVQTRMVYGEELQFWSAEKEAEGLKNFVSKDPVTSTVHQKFKHKDYDYILEMDGAGSIVGGEWISLTRPDFIWMKRRDDGFRNGVLQLSGLNQIYRPIRR